MKTLCLLLLSLAAAFAGEENVTHRVTGLFSPPREAALRAAMEKLPGVKLVSVDFAHAEAVFAYDAAVVFEGVKPEQVVEQFNDAIRGATNATLGIAPVIPRPKDKLVRIGIEVAGCDCQACGLGAYEIIFKIEGVAAATVDFKIGRISALIDSEKTNRAALEAALKNRGVVLKTADNAPAAN